MKYFISKIDIERSDKRARNSFLSKPERVGYVRLFNKNANRTTYYKIIKLCQSRYGFIVERKSPIDPYWKECLIKILK